MKPRRQHSATCLTLLFLLGPVAVAEDIDPNNDDSQHAWTENAGWINLEPSGNGGPGLEVDDFDVTGWIWGENVGWISAACDNTASCGGVDHGVTNDGHGNLAGFAWGENIGWISFSCSNTSSCGTASYGVVVDPDTGEFDGHAWAENAGWIRFSSTGANPFTIKTDWCQTVAGSPAGLPDVVVDAAGDLVWSPLGDVDWYELVQGDLTTLLASDGDYSSATTVCAGDNTTATVAPLSGTPSPGLGIWYLVRGVNCKGKGSYDSGGVNQTDPRDSGIVASGSDCP